MCEQHRTQHLIFTQLIGLGFNHQHCIFSTSHNHVQLAVSQLLVGGVEDITLGFSEADTGTANRTVEWAAGNSQCRRGAYHGLDIRVDVLVCRHHRAHYLYFIHEAIGKQWADRTIDKTRGQRFLFAGTTFTLEKATRDTPGCIGFFLVIDGERKEWTTRISRSSTDYGNHDNGIAH